MITPPRRFRPGILTVARVNEIVDCLSALCSSVEKFRVRAGSGLVSRETAGGTILSLVSSARSASGSSSSAIAAGHPFEVTPSLDSSTGRLSLSVSGGAWYGNGGFVQNGITENTAALTPDTFQIPDCEFSADVSAGQTVAVLLYAPARCGVITEDPWLYYLALPDGVEALQKRLRQYHYSTAVIVGAWKVSQTETSETTASGLALEPAPGQILKSDFWHTNSHIISNGKFGWARCDGAENTFSVSEGFVLVRPHSYSWALNPGEALTIETQSKDISIKIPKKVYEFAAEYPESEIVFLKSVALQSDSSQTTLASVSLPKLSPSTTSSTASITYATADGTQEVSGTSSAPYLTSATLTKGTTTVYSAPTGEYVYFYGLLTADGTRVTSTSSLVSVSVDVPKLATKTAEITYVSGVTMTQVGSTTVQVGIPIGLTLETETGSFNPIVGGSIKEMDTGETFSATATAQVSTAEATDATNLTSELFPDVSGDAEFLPEATAAKKFFPKLHSIQGATFSLSESEIDIGVIVFLYCSVTNGNDLSAEWKTVPIGSSPDLGEVSQSLALSISGRVVDDSDGTCENHISRKTLAIRAALDESNFTNYASAFPMAIICRGYDGSVTVQPLVSGVLTFSPTLNISLNTTARNTQNLAGVNALAVGNESELLAAEKFSPINQTAAQAQAALALMASGGEPVFNVEAEDINAALTATISEGEE